MNDEELYMYLLAIDFRIREEVLCSGDCSDKICKDCDEHLADALLMNKDVQSYACPLCWYFRIICVECIASDDGDGYCSKSHHMASLKGKRGALLKKLNGR